jgi:hypothetical protein
VLETDRVFGCASEGDPANTFFDYGWPAVAVNGAGDVGVVSIRSSEASYPQLRASAYYATESDIRSSSLMFAGNASFSYGTYATDPVLRYADLAGASVDPYDDTAIWFAHESPYVSASLPNNLIRVGKLFGSLHPDLVTTTMSLSLAQVHVGSQFTITSTVANDGDGVAYASYVKVYMKNLSGIIHLPTAVGTFILPTITPTTTGNGYAASYNITVPGTLSPGTYAVYLGVDSSNVIPEYNENNNTSSPYVGTKTITVLP